MRTSVAAAAALGLVALGAYGATAYRAETEALVARAKDYAAEAMAAVGLGTEPAAAPAQPNAGGNGARAANRAAAPVEVAEAVEDAASNDLMSVGTLTSDESVYIAAEQAGRIAELKFREGDPVEEGDLLVKLDDAVLRAEYADAEAKARLAEQNFERADTLNKTGSGTQRTRDEALSARESARAALELARVRLSKTEIRAPFRGVVGLRNRSVGSFVQAGETLVNLEKIDALKLDFRIPERRMDAVKVGLAVEITVDAFPNRTFQGSIYAIDPLLDVNGRALKVRARLDNADLLLRPGLFARVKVKSDISDRVVVVPEAALVPRGDVNVVYVIEGGKAVEAVVELGSRRAGFVEIRKGLAVGASVAIAGQARLRNGAVVEVVASSDAAATVPSDARGTPSGT